MEKKDQNSKLSATTRSMTVQGGGFATDIKSRVLWMIENLSPKGRKYRYVFLESQTGISARRWKNMCNGVTSPSIEMLAQLALLRPCLAEWLLTGSACVEQAEPSNRPSLLR